MWDWYADAAGIYCQAQVIDSADGVFTDENATVRARRGHVVARFWFDVVRPRGGRRETGYRYTVYPPGIFSDHFTPVALG